MMSSDLQLSVPIQPIDYPPFVEAGVSVSVLRLDLIHPRVSGNKWFKLRYNLQQAQAEGCRTLVSFGGAWSNHLHALSWAAREAGFHSLGFVRGELAQPLNACLADCEEQGMQLVPLSRDDYRRRNDTGFVSRLIGDIDRPFVIPEGGANQEGMRGCSDIIGLIDESAFDLLVLACGTGTTMAGLLMKARIPVLGIQVLRGEGYLQREVQAMLSAQGIQAGVEWRVDDGFHRGGYARVDEELLAFCAGFEADTGVPLEPVYSGKLMLALTELVRTGRIPAGRRVLAIHGGGLQGLRGYSVKTDS